MTASTLEAHPTAPPAPAEERTWLTPRVLALLGIGLPTLMILVVMSGTLGRVSPQSGFPFFSLDVNWPALFTANTPTGGDMGAHVLLPQHLGDNLLPAGRILGWSNDWYAGYPALFFYFPLPALVTVLLDALLPYGVAFKLVAVAGLLALPGAVYFFVRKMGFGRPVAAVATVTGSMYVFMESFSIFGGNIKSTLAGEFSFGWSFALSLVYLGLVIRDTREGRRLSVAAGVVLALTALSHVVTTIVVVVASLPLLLRRDGPRTLLTSWGLGFALAAFWALPFAVAFLQGLATDMGWFPVSGLVGEGIAPGTVATPLPNEFIPVFALGVVGFAWTAMRRHDIGVLATMTVLPFVGYWLLQLPEVELTVVYNARLLPYWYLGGFIFAGLALGMAVTAAARWLPLRRQNLAVGVALLALVLVNVTVAGIHDVPGWVRWNFTGYEGKEGYEEYAALMAEVDELPPGRIMWEANGDMNRYGTPMALMLFPYWSDDHPSMEGLYFESSITTPFHFINASEVSLRPSNPVRGLNYRRLDLERGVRHLQVYNVRYYVSFTDEGAEAARTAGLVQLGTAEPWTIFATPDSSLVDVATTIPTVYDGDGDFFEAALEWYDDVDNLDRWMVADGPARWPRIDAVDARLDLARPTGSRGGTVSDVVLEDHRISFRTTAVGVPHLVKVSYFPNWQAEGADGPYRAAPSVMVVVPTEEEVVLEFTRSPAEAFGMLLTVMGLVAAIGISWWRRSPRRRGEAS